MKIILLHILLVALSFSAFAQSRPCDNYDCMMTQARAALQKEQYREALNKARAAKAFDATKSKEADSFIEAVFYAIEQKKTEAESAQKEAENQALIAKWEAKRAGKMARLSQNLALAAEFSAFDPTLSLNITRYCFANNPEDLSAKSNYKKYLDYSNNMACKMVLGHKDPSQSLSEDFDEGGYLAYLSDEDTSQSLSRVKAVSISADGKKAIVQFSAVAQLYDLETGAYEILQFDESPLFYDKIILAPDGKKCYAFGAYGSRRKVVQCYDLEDKKMYSISLEVSAIEISKNSSFCILGTTEGTLYKWTPATDSLEQFSGKHYEKINDISISADGKYFLTGSDDRSARLWSLKSKKTVQVYLGHEGAVIAVALSPDAKKCITSGTDFGIRIWKAETGRLQTELSGFFQYTATQIEYSEDGNSFFIGNSAEPTRKWDTKTLRLIRTFSEVRAPFAISGFFVLTRSVDEKARLWYAKDMPGFRSFQNRENPIKAVQLFDNNRFAYLVAEDGELIFWNIERAFLYFKANENLSKAVNPEKIFVDTANHQVIVSSSNNRIWKYHYGHSSSKIELYPVGEDLRGNSFFMDFNELRKTRLLERSTDKLVIDTSYLQYQLDGVLEVDPQYLDPNTGRFVSFENDSLFLTAERSTIIAVVNMTKGVTVKELIGHTGNVIATAFSSDGKWCISGSMDNTAKVWDIATGELIYTFVGHLSPVNHVTISDDKQFCTTMSQDGTVIIWQTTSDCSGCNTYQSTTLDLLNNGVLLEPEDLKKN